MTISTDFHADAAWAHAQDDADPLRGLRAEFLIPPHASGEQTYLVGNSLGLPYVGRIKVRSAGSAAARLDPAYSLRAF
ncbi:MAG TPA: hypothetical protein VF284_02930 [Rhodanobacteraceae bacterium]